MANPNNLCPGCMNEKLADGKCPICGYNPEEPVNPMFLRPGSMLDGRYMIGKAIDNNGEGITYLGYDTVSGTTVNIREFFPVGLCERSDDGSVLMLSGAEFDFNDTLIKFVELSKKLFQFNDLPALFDIVDIREANSTAYRIVKAVPSITLREFLMRNGGMLKWDQARSLFAPLVSSIDAIHKAGIIHRGISPDTLYVGKDGKVRIAGFCIPETRTARSAVTSQLFPGFAAIEQYGEAGAQGTWTDVYAFAATIYRTLVGNPPPEATERIENDNMTIPAKIAHETPKAVLETLANALQVLPDDRTMEIDEMRKGLSVSAATTTAAEKREPATPAAPQRSTKSKKKKGGSGKMYGLVACVATAFLLAIIVFFVLSLMGVFEPEDPSTNSSGNGLDASYVVSQNIASKSEIQFDPGLTALPSFKGLKYADVINNIDFEGIYKFKVTSKQYSDTYKAGYIISQSPAEGTTVEKNTTIEVVLSLGPYYMSMPDLTGMTKDEAILALLKAGFEYDNITFSERYVEEKAPNSVVETVPGFGQSVNADSRIEVIINSFKGTDPTE